MTDIMGAQKQFYRYAIVGFASNALGHVIYRVLRRPGLGPRLLISLLFRMGVRQTVLTYRRWALGSCGARRLAFVEGVMQTFPRSSTVAACSFARAGGQAARAPQIQLTSSPATASIGQ